MKAVVMTCDRYRALTEHMMFKYEQLWPDHPFHFRIPYQDRAPTRASAQTEYVRTPVAIKATVLALLADLDDEELIYWCIDDKYPVELNVPEVEHMLQWLVRRDNAGIDGLLFCRARRMWDQNYLTGHQRADDSGHVYLERSSYKQIWIHQFLRVKVLRHLFLSFPDKIPYAKYMDTLVDRAVKPAAHRIYVSHRNFAVFGESTFRGKVTRNCYESIRENDLALPSWFTKPKDRVIFIGAEKWTAHTYTRPSVFKRLILGITRRFS